MRGNKPRNRVKVTRLFEVLSDSIRRADFGEKRDA
jgi:hypothetical protein